MGREEHTHLAVAAATAAGRPRHHGGSARFALDFVPVTREPYDLVLATETLEDLVTAPL
jgi:putative molybdopterin biosynthesis protein